MRRCRAAPKTWYQRIPDNDRTVESKDSSRQAVPVLRGIDGREGKAGEGGTAEPGAADRAEGGVCVYQTKNREGVGLFPAQLTAVMGKGLT